MLMGQIKLKRNRLGVVVTAHCEERYIASPGIAVVQVPDWLRYTYEQMEEAKRINAKKPARTGK